MSHVIWVDTAEADRDAAIEYIAEYSLDSALRQFDEITQQTERLLRFPELGRPGRRRGLRELSINRTSFVVTYRVLRTDIEIVMFRHTAQDDHTD